jgi:hypothetical protein
MNARVSTALRVLVATLTLSCTIAPAAYAYQATPAAPGAQRKGVKKKVEPITPVKPTPTPPSCGGRGERSKQTYVFNFEAPKHYRYAVKGQTLVSGASFPADGQTITITAVPDGGYGFGKTVASWDYALTPARCGG